MAITQKKDKVCLKRHFMIMSLKQEHALYRKWDWYSTKMTSSINFPYVHVLSPLLLTHAKGSIKKIIGQESRNGPTVPHK